MSLEESRRRWDEQFLAGVRKVESLKPALAKHLRIRVEAWIRKLTQAASNETLLRNRNAYLDLLLMCIIRDEYPDPFHRMPPEGPLPGLPQHVACMVRQRRLKQGVSLASDSITLPVAEIESDFLSGISRSQSSSRVGVASACRPRFGQGPDLDTNTRFRRMEQELAKVKLENRKLRTQLRSASQSARSEESLSDSSWGFSAARPRQDEDLVWQDTSIVGTSWCQPGVQDTASFLKYLDKFQQETKGLVSKACFARGENNERKAGPRAASSFSRVKPPSSARVRSPSSSPPASPRNKKFEERAKRVYELIDSCVAHSGTLGVLGL
mmetsp:Transcript_55270/g.147569  ORF Transcript_55270/g.147569 Transcript_55270/m.147569 type:complete len:325 (-) Transcript_55270:79-1053(-)